MKSRKARGLARAQRPSAPTREEQRPVARRASGQMPTMASRDRAGRRSADNKAIRQATSLADRPALSWIRAAFRLASEAMVLPAPATPLFPLERAVLPARGT